MIECSFYYNSNKGTAGLLIKGLIIPLLANISIILEKRASYIDSNEAKILLRH